MKDSDTVAAIRALLKVKGNHPVANKLIRRAIVAQQEHEKAKLQKTNPSPRQ